MEDRISGPRAGIGVPGGTVLAPGIRYSCPAALQLIRPSLRCGRPFSVLSIFYRYRQIPQHSSYRIQSHSFHRLGILRRKGFEGGELLDENKLTGFLNERVLARAPHHVKHANA
jgi:hypothetical protein